MAEIIFLNPKCTHNIWGGNKLRTMFGYDVEGDDLGECWGISAHPNGDGIVREGTYAGMHLSELFASHRELFGNIQSDRFPLLTKIIDAKDDLSIQVHPEDEYARVHENGSLGKTECWYILDCDADADIVIGHNASTREELADMIHEGRWNELIRTIPIHKGDFMQIDPGTVHAIKGGTLILETQQNSDITYRLYDYDRLQNGKPRDLHLNQSIDVITVPAKSVEESIVSFADISANEMVEMYACSYYRIFKMTVAGQMTLNNDFPFMLCSVVEGCGTIDGKSVKAGDHFILPSGYKEAELEGEMTLITSVNQ